ncbi:LysR family transcriptional regulator [Pendulispora albinea]|uniref:LysR family transcriptional regulator n=1 Tax=Pendulispora albinea TaxID=2741071 RepID=A0ABZ2LQJ2_9BACT
MRAGSFTAAAEPLGLTKAMVSHHLARLERELGVSLMVRTTRRMALTEAGAAFHADCVRILSETNAAIARVAQNREKPTGTLRLTSSTDYGPGVLAPLLADFMRRHPQLQVDLVIGDEIRDLIAERFDLAIRVGWLRDSSLRTVRLAAFHQLVVAAPHYLTARGTPRTPLELANHDWIAVAPLPSPLRWTFTGTDGNRRTVRMRQVAQANNVAAVRGLVINGAGISILPDCLIGDDVRQGRLVSLLPTYRLREGGIHAVYPGPQAPPKVRLFIEYLRTRLAQA